MKNATSINLGMMVASCLLITGVAWAKPPFPVPAKGGLPECKAELAECLINLTETEMKLQVCEDELAQCQATQGQAFPATGQTTCWDSSGNEIVCEGTGQDGDIQAGAKLSYMDNGLTITDKNTKLEWMKKDNNNGDCASLPGSLDHDCNFTWDEAFAFVADLNTAPCFAGHCDWRVPNVKELMSIVNYGNQSPMISAEFNNGCESGACTVNECSCTESVAHWSSTSHESPDDAKWVSFNDGEVQSGSKGTDWPVRAVRGGL